MVKLNNNPSIQDKLKAWAVVGQYVTEKGSFPTTVALDTEDGLMCIRPELLANDLLQYIQQLEDELELTKDAQCTHAFTVVEPSLGYELIVEECQFCGLVGYSETAITISEILKKEEQLDESNKSDEN